MEINDCETEMIKIIVLIWMSIKTSLKILSAKVTKVLTETTKCYQEKFRFKNVIKCNEYSEAY